MTFTDLTISLFDTKVLTEREILLSFGLLYLLRQSRLKICIDSKISTDEYECLFACKT